MNKEHDERREERFEPYPEEPPLEDFLIDEYEEPSEEEKKRKAAIKKTIVVGLSGLLIVNILAIWMNLFSLDALQFLKTSNELSQQEEISELKRAVVTIQADRSKGTGFAVSEDGLIITNDHVIDGSRSLIISFPDGQLFEGEVIDKQPELDLAFVKVEGNKLPHLTLSPSGAEIGENIYVIGNPLAHNQIVTDGTVVSNDEALQVLKISAPIYKGNSGSPVLNEAGQVVGVVYAKTIPRLINGDDPVGLAIPIDYVNERLEQVNRQK